LEPTYPFCTIIKLLIAFHITERESKLSVENVFKYIITNNSTGVEDIDYYISLSPNSISINNNEYRQIHEMLIFISQLSFLKYHRDNLWLDIENDSPLNDLLTKYLNPIITLPNLDRTQDFIDLTHISQKISYPDLPFFKINPSFTQFIEGKRHRVIHFRIERSLLLRKEGCTEFN
jgi:hypothetical protein